MYILLSNTLFCSPACSLGSLPDARRPVLKRDRPPQVGLSPRVKQAGPGEERMGRLTNRKCGGRSKLPAANSSSCLLGNQHTPEIPSRLLNAHGSFQKPHWAPARARHGTVTARLHTGPHKTKSLRLNLCLSSG